MYQGVVEGMYQSVQLLAEISYLSSPPHPTPPHPSSWRVGASHGSRSFAGIVHTATIYCTPTQVHARIRARAHTHTHTSNETETNYIGRTSAGPPQCCFMLAFLGALPCLLIFFSILHTRHSLILQHKDYYIYIYITYFTTTRNSVFHPHSVYTCLI